MSYSYLQIDSKLANDIRLIMTDVDGTITDLPGRVEAVAEEAIRVLLARGITVGFVSGRTLPRLEPIAIDIGINGPIIGENGGIAKLKATGRLLNLGYSREPALRDLERLRQVYPNAIEPTEDDADRLVDVGFKAPGIDTVELRKHLRESELLDSGYMLHMLQKGVGKGVTLKRILPRIGDGKLSREQVLVLGDSLTDISLFRIFPHSVFILNTRISAMDRATMEEAAKYVSDLEFGAGFAQVTEHMLGLRR
jgi:hydroxymethylpyrimidine pyrophosphatase-like HAD family hydrolase